MNLIPWIKIDLAKSWKRALEIKDGGKIQQNIF